MNIYALIDYNLKKIKYCYFVIWSVDKFCFMRKKLKKFEPNKKLEKYKIMLFDVELGDQDYTYCVYFSDNKHVPKKKNLKNISKYEIKQKQKQRCIKSTNFVFGSCNYSLFISNQGVYTGCETFKNMLHCDPDFGIFLGDQIYADVSYPFNPCINIEDYKNLYKLQLNQPDIKKFLGTIPTYNILDDHEIYNDFTCPDAIRKIPFYNSFYKYMIKPSKQHITDGLTTYKTIQYIYNPGGLENINKIKKNDLHYTFSKKFCEFFIVDMRTDCSKKYYMSEKQTNELIYWLKNCPRNSIKFIGTSLPIYPKFTKEKVEKKFPTKVIDYIFRNNIQKVIFLCGDVHFSYIAKTICNKKYIKIINKQEYTKAIQKKKSNNYIYTICSSPINLLPVGNTLSKHETKDIYIDGCYESKLIKDFIYPYSNFVKVSIKNKNCIKIKLVSKTEKKLLRHSINY